MRGEGARESRSLREWGTAWKRTRPLNELTLNYKYYKFSPSCTMSNFRWTNEWYNLRKHFSFFNEGGLCDEFLQHGVTSTSCRRMDLCTVHYLIFIDRHLQSSQYEGLYAKLFLCIKRLPLNYIYMSIFLSLEGKKPIHHKKSYEMPHYTKAAL